MLYNLRVVEFHLEITKMNEITSDSLPTLLSEGPVLVDFYADWCQPCRAIKPVLEQLSTENNDIKFVMVNIENSPQLAELHKISALPTIVLMDGDRQKSLVGLHSKSAIQECINSFLANK